MATVPERAGRAAEPEAERAAGQIRTACHTLRRTSPLGDPPTSPATVVTPVAAKPRPLTPRALDVAMCPARVRVSQARRITRAFMRLWGLPESLGDDVRVAVSELVTNAIEHGCGTVGLRMRHTDDELRVEVTDESSAPARLRDSDDEDVCGRGLFLVASLADAWGVSDNGRTTWAAFTLAGKTW
jgi:serine/threonine-protein kinase RsbW